MMSQNGVYGTPPRLADLLALPTPASSRGLSKVGTSPRGGGLAALASSWTLAGDKPAERDLRVRTAEQIQHRRRFRPMVIMFIGRRGSGKSLAMSTLAHIQKRRYAQAGLDEVFSVVANYKLTFARKVTPNLVMELINFPPWAWNLYVCIDEIANAFPARRSLAGMNVLFSAWLQQIRKRHCEVAFTTQFPQVMDYQVLLQVDLFIRCKEHLGGRAIELFFYDWWGQYTGHDYKRAWPPDPDDWDWSLELHHTDKIWPFYDTDEVVPPVWSHFREDVLLQEGWIPSAPEEDEEVTGAEPELWIPPSTNGHVQGTPVLEGLPSGTATFSEWTKELDRLVADYWSHHGKFDASMLLDQAIQLNSEINSMTDFCNWLEVHGYTVERKRRTFYVDRKP